VVDLRYLAGNEGGAKMSNLEELVFLDATAQAELVRRKEIKPIELVEACIERIERLNPTLNAVITSMYDQAREAAKGELPNLQPQYIDFHVKIFPTKQNLCYQLIDWINLKS
jgi:hypothetical protein